MQGNNLVLKNKSSFKERKERKVIELELEEMISFKMLSPERVELKKEVKGKILSFNEKGILLLTDDPLREGSFVNLSINFKGLGVLDDILGRVKRVEESDEHDFYVGVELYSPEQIKAEALSELLPEKLESFDIKLKKSLIDYFNGIKNQKQKFNPKPE
jgi:rRNA processing protein Gar1